MGRAHEIEKRKVSKIMWITKLKMKSHFNARSAGVGGPILKIMPPKGRTEACAGSASGTRATHRAHVRARRTLPKSALQQSPRNQPKQPNSAHVQRPVGRCGDQEYVKPRIPQHRRRWWGEAAARPDPDKAGVSPVPITRHGTASC